MNDGERGVGAVIEPCLGVSSLSDHGDSPPQVASKVFDVIWWFLRPVEIRKKHVILLGNVYSTLNTSFPGCPQYNLSTGSRTDTDQCLPMSRVHRSDGSIHWCQTSYCAKV